MHVYNTATNSTHAATPMPQQRVTYGMTMLNSEIVLVCGGEIDSAIVNTCWLYSSCIGGPQWRSGRMQSTILLFYEQIISVLKIDRFFQENSDIMGCCVK